MLFFAETFQPMNAAVTIQIGLNDSARVVRGKFTFAGAWESFQGIRTIYNMYSSIGYSAAVYHSLLIAGYLSHYVDDRIFGAVAMTIVFGICTSYYIVSLNFT